MHTHTISGAHLRPKGLNEFGNGLSPSLEFVTHNTIGICGTQKVLWEILTCANQSSASQSIAGTDRANNGQPRLRSRRPDIEGFPISNIVYFFTYPQKYNRR